MRGDGVRVPRPGGVRGGVRGGVHPHRGQEDQDGDQREVRGQAEQNLRGPVQSRANREVSPHHQTQVAPYLFIITIIFVSRLKNIFC